MITSKKFTITALAYFLFAALLGILLRLFPIANINATYKFIVHAHSHIALLGWVYVGLTTLIFYLFIKNESKKKYSKIFIATQITILGMLFSFPFTGYALISIIFSTLFLFCSYIFYSYFRKHNNLNKTDYSYKFINTSLILMIVSSLGPWALGYIMNTLGSTSHWYKNAIYFYLHFQYNGWFIFCLLGLFFHFLEKKQNIFINKKTLSNFYKLMLYSCILTLFLSFLWMQPSKAIYLLAIVGGLYQILALKKLSDIITEVKHQIKRKLDLNFYKILKVIYILFIIKMLMQSLTAIPYFADLAYRTTDFVIGYLHLIFLGLTSLSLFFLLHQNKLLYLPKKWLIIYLIGFIGSEILIFYKGFCIWQQLSIIDNYYTILVSFSALIPLSLIGIFIQNLKPTYPTQEELL